MKTTAIWLSALLIMILNASSSHAAVFTPLGDLPGGTLNSTARGISADGSVVVGRGECANGNEAFRWTEADGMVGLGYIPGGLLVSSAYGVSDDGSVVVGYSGSAGSFHEAFHWTQAGGMVGLGDLPGATVHSHAYAVSGDGSVVVGDGDATPFVRGFIWTEEEGMSDLGGFRSRPWGVSRDGSVVVGYDRTANGVEAFRWTQAEGIVGLGDLPGGTSSSKASGVSADGSVIVGYGTSANGPEAFRWTEAEGMVGLGYLPGGEVASYAGGVSADGSVVVGMSYSTSGGEAYRWTQGSGIVAIRELLEVQGVDLTGWQLNSAGAVSADGNIIVGTGTNPDGNTEAWLADLETERKVIPYFPDYRWNYGCAPTSAAMIAGYYDRKPQFADLAPGDEAPLTSGEDTNAIHPRDTAAEKYEPAFGNPLVNAMIASEGHHRDYWAHGKGPDAGADVDPMLDNHVDDCIADFLHTSRKNMFPIPDAPNGQTLKIDQWRIRQWVASRGYDSAFSPMSPLPWFEGYGGLFDFITEHIDAGRPLMVDWSGGHTVACYGYEDGPGDDDWLAVNDTLGDGNTNNWTLGSGGGQVEGRIDAEGREWWRFRASDDGTHAWVDHAAAWWPTTGVSSGAIPRGTLFSESLDLYPSDVPASLLGYTVDAGSGSGVVQLVVSPLDPANHVLQLHNPDPGGVVAVELDVLLSEVVDLSFDYLFATDGKLIVSADGVVLTELLCPTEGPGSVGAGEFAVFTGRFSLDALGLTPAVMTPMRFELSASGDPTCYIDNIWVSNSVPEPGTATVFTIVALLVLRFRRRQNRSR